MSENDYEKRFELIEQNIAKLLIKNVALTKEVGKLREIIEAQELEIYKCNKINQNLLQEVNNLRKELLDCNTTDEEVYLLVNSLIDEVDKNSLLFDSYLKSHTDVKSKELSFSKLQMLDIKNEIAKVDAKYDKRIEDLEDESINAMYKFEDIDENIDKFDMDLIKSVNKSITRLEDKIEEIENIKAKQNSEDSKQLIENNNDSFLDKIKNNSNNTLIVDSIYDTERVFNNVVYATRKQKKAILKLVKIKNFNLKEDVEFISKKDAGVLIGYLKGTAKNVSKDFLNKYLEEKEISSEIIQMKEENTSICEIKEPEDYSLKINPTTTVSGPYKPIAIKIEDEVMDVCSKWYDLIFKMNEYLCKNNKDYRNKILYDRNKKTLDTYLSSNKSKLENPVEISNSAIFLTKEIYYSSIALDLIKELALIFNIDKNDIVIYLK